MGGLGDNDGLDASGSRRDLLTSEDAASCWLPASLCKCRPVSDSRERAVDLGRCGQPFHSPSLTLTSDPESHMFCLFGRGRWDKGTRGSLGVVLVSQRGPLELYVDIKWAIEGQGLQEKKSIREKSLKVRMFIAVLSKARSCAKFVYGMKNR